MHSVGARLAKGEDAGNGLTERHRVCDSCGALHRRGMTILMVEQNARLALRASDRAYMLSTDSVVREGRAKDLLEDEPIRKAYLG